MNKYEQCNHKISIQMMRDREIKPLYSGSTQRVNPTLQGKKHHSPL